MLDGWLVLWVYSMRKFVPFAGRAAGAAIMQVSELCSSWRFRLTSKRGAHHRSVAGIPPWFVTAPGAIQSDINCSVDLRSTAAVGDRRYSRMRKQ